jgi:hypothetical protein
MFGTIVEFILFVLSLIFWVIAIYMTFKVIFASVTILYCAKTLVVWTAAFINYKFLM